MLLGIGADEGLLMRSLVTSPQEICLSVNIGVFGMSGGFIGTPLPFVGNTGLGRTELRDLGIVWQKRGNAKIVLAGGIPQQPAPEEYLHLIWLIIHCLGDSLPL